MQTLVDHPVSEVLEPLIKNAFEQLMGLYNLIIPYDIASVKLSTPDSYTDITFIIKADSFNIKQICMALQNERNLSSGNHAIINIYDKHFEVNIIEETDTTLTIRLTNITS